MMIILALEIYYNTTIYIYIYIYVYVCLGIHYRGCSGMGVQWMGVVLLCNKLVYTSIQITTPCLHCTPL